MHPNPAYRKVARETNLALARDRSFGTLAVNADEGPLLSHVPFLLSEDGATVGLHLVRSNPIARLGPTAAVIAVAGPDAYVSPDWYGIEDQVPTWNYVAVHLRGTLAPLPDEDLPVLLDRQSEAYEDRLLPKPQWTTGKLSEETRSRLLRMIRPFRLTIHAVDGTWKFSQNKPDAARIAAAGHVSGESFGAETAALADLMRAAE